MPDNRKRNAFLLAIIAILFLYGVTKLLALRFEEGDVYPAYSSSRYDPLGTRALYEGLKNLLGDSISRNYDSLGRLEAEENTTLMYLGTREKDRVFYCEKQGETLKRFAAAGGRVVISFLPVTKTYSLKDPSEDSGADPGDSGDAPLSKGKEEKPEEKSTAQTKGEKNARAKDTGPAKKMGCEDSPRKFWGFSFGYEENHALSGDAEFIPGSPEGSYLPPVTWHTTLFFDNLGKDWRVIYTRNSHPVIIEKEVGRGVVVLSADSYFLSNEALLKERRSELLSWIVGNTTKVIFDESHLGIQKNLGIATLGRKYNLQWLFFGLILFGLLFVWKNSARFVPPPEEMPKEDNSASGSTRDYKEGLVSLLRRNIREDQILNVCAETWENSVSGENSRLPETMETGSQIKAVVDSERQRQGKRRNPVNAYREICNILSKRKIL